MIVLHRIPFPVAERVFFAVGEDELRPERHGEELTIPVGKVRSGNQLVPAGVRVRFVRCYSPHYPPACRLEIIGTITHTE